MTRNITTVLSDRATVDKLKELAPGGNVAGMLRAVAEGEIRIPCKTIDSLEANVKAMQAVIESRLKKIEEKMGNIDSMLYDQRGRRQEIDLELDELKNKGMPAFKTLREYHHQERIKDEDIEYGWTPEMWGEKSE